MSSRPSSFRRAPALTAVIPYVALAAFAWASPLDAQEDGADNGHTRIPTEDHRRIDEWFGHYLEGEPAPAWMTEGVPYLEQPGGQERRGGR